MNKRIVAIIISCYFTLFVGFSIRYAYGLLLPEMLPSLDITKAKAGIIYASYFIAYTVCSPVFGLLADRYSIRFILACCVALLGTGTCLMAYSTSVLNAGLFFSIVGVGHAACWVSVVALIQRWVSDRRRGTALAIVDTGSASGIAVWGFILPVIVSGHGWKAGWVGLGGFGLVVS
ncbi:MFS transporter, partial [Thermodesulfobacteriota bacterium]